MTKGKVLASGVLVVLVAFVPLSGQSNAAESGRIEDLLSPILKEFSLPAMGGAVVTGQGLRALGVVGVRKAATDVAATAGDLWHLGSNTKAMTAALVAALVEQGKLKWETTVEEKFADLAPSMPPALRKVNLLHLLSHRAGLPANTLWGLVPRTQTIREQRLAAVKAASSLKELVSAPGSTYLYSNLGYVVAGAMAEAAAGETWEELITKTIFAPLGMENAGFGGTGTPGIIDQPWGHTPDGQPVKENGPEVDNPPVIGPAGRVHCTLNDWAKFIADVVRGCRGEKALLKPESYKMLQTPPFGGNYALGWGVAEREWGGGPVLTHSGSNTMNMAVVWIAPLRDFAVLVVANQGGVPAAKACDRAASSLIRWHEREPK